MNIDKAIEQAESYISRLNEIIKWFKEATVDELQQTGEVVLEQYKEIFTGWEISESWGIFEEESKQQWDKYQRLFISFENKIAELNKEIEEACQPLTRWDILAMKADDRYDERRAEEAQAKRK
jgi:hypothetical protein